MAELELVVEGKRYGGWKSISITRSIEQLAHTFSLGFTERWLPEQNPLPIREGFACRVDYDSKPILLGYVDDASVDYDTENHSATVEGRSITADLVDCSARVKSWRKQTLKNIADALCLPFGISVTVAHGVDVSAKIRAFSVQDGETVFEALSRLAAMRGVLLLSDDRGNVLITRAGSNKTSTVIKYGQNALRGGRRGSARERFSDYTLKAQIFGDEEFNGELAMSIRADVSDSGVRRYRPLTVLADAQDTKSELRKRAEWERNIRVGRSLRLTYTMQGWEHESGVWAPNLLVQVDDSLLGVKGEFLIMSARLIRDERGSVTELELAAPEVLSVEPAKQVKRGPGFTL